jgi:hypothetical protein
MTKNERIEILSEVVVIATTMKKVSEEFLKVPATPSNIRMHVTVGHLLNELAVATQSLTDTVSGMKTKINGYIK